MSNIFHLTTSTVLTYSLFSSHTTPYIFTGFKWRSCCSDRHILRPWYQSEACALSYRFVSIEWPPPSQNKWLCYCCNATLLDHDHINNVTSYYLKSVHLKHCVFLLVGKMVLLVFWGVQMQWWRYITVYANDMILKCAFFVWTGKLYCNSDSTEVHRRTEARQGVSHLCRYVIENIFC